MLAGQPDTPPWTALADDGERATFYAGPATIELHRSETANYRDNLASGSPALWVVLRETGVEPPYALYLVTADPAEGEGMTAAGNNIVEPVPMPDVVRDTIAAFVAEHHVDEVFVKRKRTGRTRNRSDAARPPRRDELMTDRENFPKGFLERWSRKKIEGERETTDARAEPAGGCRCPMNRARPSVPRRSRPRLWPKRR